MRHTDDLRAALPFRRDSPSSVRRSFITHCSVENAKNCANAEAASGIVFDYERAKSGPGTTAKTSIKIAKRQVITADCANCACACANNPDNVGEFRSIFAARDTFFEASLPTITEFPSSQSFALQQLLPRQRQHFSAGTFLIYSRHSASSLKSSVDDLPRHDLN